MRAMYIWAELDHDLVHTATKERIHTQLEALSEPNIFRQILVTILPGIILLIGPIAILGVSRAYGSCNKMFSSCLSLGQVRIDGT